MRKSRLFWRVGAGCGALVWLTLVPSICRAKDTAPDVAAADRAAAQALFDEGRQLMADGKVPEACDKFEASAKVLELPGILLNLGDCYEKQDRLATAWSTFIRAGYVANHAGNAARESEARVRTAALAGKLPKLTIQVAVPARVPGLEVKRDGQVVTESLWGTGIPTDPGTHQISATAPGYRPWSTSVEAKRGKTTNVEVPALVAEGVPEPAAVAEAPPAEPVKEVRPEPKPAPKASPQPPASTKLGTRKTLALVSGGLGVVGMAVGTAAGIVSWSKHNEGDDNCGDSGCNSTGVDARDDAMVAGNVSTVAFIVGVAGLAGGAALWFTAPKSEAATAGLQQLGVGPGTIALRGTW